MEEVIFMFVNTKTNALKIDPYSLFKSWRTLNISNQLQAKRSFSHGHENGS